MCPGVYQVTYIKKEVMLRDLAAGSSAFLRCLERLGKRNTCIVYGVACRASLVSSSASNLDFSTVA